MNNLLFKRGGKWNTSNTSVTTFNRTNGNINNNNGFRSVLVALCTSIQKEAKRLLFQRGIVSRRMPRDKTDKLFKKTEFV